MTLAGLAFQSAAAQAVTFEVQGKKGESLFRSSEPVDLKKETVGSATILFLEKARQQGLLRYQGNDGGLVSINELGNDTEVLSDTRMKAFGWCYSINGKTPGVMPDRIHLANQTDHLTWFYAYALYESGNWVAQCVPAPQP